MYSKLGQRLITKFQILREKDEILSPPSKRLTTPQRKPEPKTVLHSPESLRKIARESMKECLSSRLRPTNHHPSASFRAQSRDNFYKGNGPKTCSPPTGHYHLTYRAIHRNPQGATIRQRSVRRQDQRTKESLLAPEKPKKHVHGSVELSKQTLRLPLTAQKSLPRNSTQQVPYDPTMPRKPTAPDFKKTLPRRPLFADQLSHSPQYFPNYSSTQKRVITPDFSRRRVLSGSHIKGTCPRMSLSTLTENRLRMRNNC